MAAAFLSGKALVAALLLAGAAPSFLLATQYAYYETVPEWRVGDTWTFRVNATVAVEARTPVGADVRDESSESLRTLRVVDDRALLGALPVYLVEESEDGGKADSRALTRDGLNPVRMTSSGPVVVEEMSWPLYAGKTWEAKRSEGTLRYRAEDRDFLTVGGATVVAIRISYGPADEAPATRLEGTLWYAPALRIIVREEARLEVRQAPSRAAVFESVVAVRVSTELVEGTVRGSALSATSAARIEPPELSLPDPLDIAAGDTAKFSAKAKDRPEGAVFRWRIDGERYEGDEVRARFDWPGLKDVEVELVRGKDVLARARDTFEVYWTSTAGGMHGPTGTNTVIDVPGAEDGRLFVTYDVGAGLLSDGSDDVSVRDPDGERVAEGDRFDVEIDEEDLWSVVVSPRFGEHLATPWRLTLSLRFGEAAREPAGSATERALALTGTP